MLTKFQQQYATQLQQHANFAKWSWGPTDCANAQKTGPKNLIWIGKDNTTNMHRVGVKRLLATYTSC